MADPQDVAGALKVVSTLENWCYLAERPHAVIREPVYPEFLRRLAADLRSRQPVLETDPLLRLVADDLAVVLTTLDDPSNVPRAARPLASIRSALLDWLVCSINGNAPAFSSGAEPLLCPACRPEDPLSHTPTARDVPATEFPYPCRKCQRMHTALVPEYPFNLLQFLRDLAWSKRQFDTAIAFDDRPLLDQWRRENWIDAPETPQEPAAETAAVVAQDQPAELTGEAKALALLVQHPEWKNTQIAEAVPCSRTTLNKWPRFMAARRSQSAQRSLPRGHRDGDTGALEAYDE